MMRVSDVIDWLDSLPPDANLGIDDDGLRLVTDVDCEAYCEIGGMPGGDNDAEG